VQFATCCRPVPGDAIVATWDAAKGWWCTAEDCAVARRLQHKDAERFIGVEWATSRCGPSRPACW
jgi:GTP pyrophosphokinase